MKKIISVVLALVMMMAVMVPAFAENIVSPDTTGNAIVLVDGVTDKGEGSYTVSIPASVDFKWNDAETTGKYTITSQVQTNSRVQVTVAKAKDLTNINDATETIAFSVADATSKATNAVVTAEEHSFKLTIDNTNDWKTKSIAKYEGTITFEAELVNA